MYKNFQKLIKGNLLMPLSDKIGKLPVIYQKGNSNNNQIKRCSSRKIKNKSN